MYDVEIVIRGQRFTCVACDEIDAHGRIGSYLIAFGLNIIIADEVRDIDAFCHALKETGQFTGSAFDAKITITRRT